jgi:hypothetical protein
MPGDPAFYLVPPGYQLQQGGKTGPYDCSAWGASRVIAKVTNGLRVPYGQRIRQLSNEPIPDRDSPGLNIPQVADVAWDEYSVYFEQHVGSRAVDWEVYEEERRDGRPCAIQVSYQPIAETKWDAGRGFVGGHLIYEDNHLTGDSLADGRAKGVHLWRPGDPQVYPRTVMKEAAGDLIVGYAEGRAIRAGNGKVWCAFGKDRTPNFRVRIPRAEGFNLFRRLGTEILFDERVRPLHRLVDEPCDPPRAFKYGGNLRYFARIRTGSYAGAFVPRHWSREVSS